MSAGHSHDNMVPAGAVRLAAGFVVASVLLVAAVRADWLPESRSAADLRTSTGVAPVAERMLRFADVDGAVVVTNAETGAAVASFGQEGSGFIRGVMRGLARERRMHGLGAEAPFRLTRFADGQLSLTDLATGRVIELNGFGHTNVAAFAGLLEAPLSARPERSRGAPAPKSEMRPSTALGTSEVGAMLDENNS